MADVKRYTVSIGSQQYSIVSDDGHEAVSKAAHTVDRIVEDILHTYADISREKAAVIAALKLAQQTNHLAATIDSYDKQSKHIAALIDEQVRPHHW